MEQLRQEDFDLLRAGYNNALKRLEIAEFERDHHKKRLDLLQGRDPGCVEIYEKAIKLAYEYLEGHALCDSNPRERILWESLEEAFKLVKSAEVKG